MRQALLGLLVLTPALSADDWPQWYGPRRDGVWRNSGPVEPFPAGGPPVLWRAPLGAGYSGPAVAGDRVYVMDRTVAKDAPAPSNPFDTKTAVPGGERVVCLDRGTGKEVWAFAYPCEYRVSYASGPRCTPTVDGNRVYALGTMGDLHCLDAATGAVVWKRNFPKEFGAKVPVWGYAASPLVDGDRLVVLAGDKIEDGHAHAPFAALNKATGEVLWRVTAPASEDFGYCPPVIYTFAGKRQLILWHSQAVLGADPETGKRLWSVPMPVKAALTAPMPVPAGGDRLFFTTFYSGSFLLKVGADAAELLWQSKAKGERPNQTVDISSIMPTPVVRGDFAYCVSSYGELTCLEVATGKRVWQTLAATRGRLTPEKVKAMDGPNTAQPWHERWSNAFCTPVGEAGARFVLFNEQGEFILADLTPKGYKEVSRAAVLEPTNRLAGRPVIWSHPAYAGGDAFARSDTELVRVKLGGGGKKD